MRPWSFIVSICLVAGTLSAQTPCDWAPQTGSVVETCGKVGIGTSAPTQLLHVSGGASQFAIFERSAKQLWVNANWSDNNLYSQVANRATDNMGLSLSSKDTSPEYLFITTDGRVGIGTAAPVARLHLDDTVQTRPRLMFSGKEYFQGLSGSSPSEGVGFLLGVNRTDNRQLWIGDMASTLAPHFRVSMFPSYAMLDAISRDGITPQRLVLGQNGNVALTPGTGKVTIGSFASYPNELTVVSTDDNVSAVQFAHAPIVEANTTQNDTGLYVYSAEGVNAGVVNAGTVTGTQSRAALAGPGRVQTTIGALIESGVYSGSTATSEVVNAYGAQVRVQATTGTVTNGYGVYIADTQAVNDYAIYQVGTDDSSYFAGDMKIGATGATGMKLTVNGDANFTGTVTGGNIQAKYQDLAEWVPSRSDLSPGTVVVLDPAIGNGVMASAIEYDTTVAGVVSAQPGILLGVAGDAKEQIATSGRVRVRVDATSAPIRIGDLLVSSNTSGRAMRSEPMEINGRKFHQPGTIIGKALQSLEGGQGEILVLLSLQ